MKRFEGIRWYNKGKLSPIEDSTEKHSEEFVRIRYGDLKVGLVLFLQKFDEYEIFGEIIKIDSIVEIVCPDKSKLIVPIDKIPRYHFFKLNRSFEKLNNNITTNFDKFNEEMNLKKTLGHVLGTL